jgi:hypothetical protein
MYKKFYGQTTNEWNIYIIGKNEESIVRWKGYKFYTFGIHISLSPDVNVHILFFFFFLLPFFIVLRIFTSAM